MPTELTQYIQHIYVFPPFKDVLLLKCLKSTLATSSTTQIQHVLLTLRALRNLYLLTYLLSTMFAISVLSSFNVTPVFMSHDSFYIRGTMK